MRKFFIWSIAIITIVMVAIFFYINHKAKLAASIPVQAKQIVCIDIQNIQKSLLTDVLMNYDEYFKKDSTENRIKGFKSSSIEIPNYIIGYSLKNAKQVFYFPFSYKDSIQFNQFLSLNNAQFNSNSGLYGFSNNINISCRSNRGLLIVGNSASIEQREITSYYRQLDRIPLTAALFKTLSNSKNHATIIDRSSFFKDSALLAINFNSESITIEGGGELSKKMDVKTVSYIANDKALGKFTFNFPQELAANQFGKLSDAVKNKIKRKTGFNLDSIYNYYNASGAIILNDFLRITDTAVTYVYDDDFNEIEKLKIDTTFIPNITSQLFKRNTGGLAYLVNDSLIKNISGDNKLVAIPFLNLLVSDSSSSLILTNGGSVNTTKANSTLMDLNLLPYKIPFSKIDYLKKYNSIGHIIESASLKISISNGFLVCKGRLDVLNKESHIISQLKGVFSDNK